MRTVASAPSRPPKTAVGLQVNLMIAGRQLDAQHLDAVGQQAPAAAIGRFGRLPGDPAEVHGQVGPGVVLRLQGFFRPVHDAFLGRAADDRPHDDARINGLVLLDGQAADVGDRGRGADGPAVGRYEHAVHGIVVDDHFRHLDRRDRGRDAVIGRGVDDGAGGKHGNRGGHFHGFHFVRPAPTRAKT